LTNASTGRTRGLVALALIALTVLCVGFAGVMVYRAGHLTDAPFSLTNNGRKVPSEEQRHKVVAVAEQFCLRVDGFDGDDPEGYRKQVEPLLTTKYKRAFESQFQAIQQLGVQRGQKGKGTVVVSGIGAIDDDSATVLVVHDNTITSEAGTVQRHYRWTIDLNKVGGRWLVDDFTPVS
jgi:hypothetical protein